jgi:predicted dehydrogenase/threonine dehydrogenase-like Zn-dependent dehydrogenase
MRQVLVKKGKVIVADVPTPRVSDKNILVRVISSCISVGTEVAGINASGTPIYRRILKQPQQVKKAVSLVCQQGFANAINQISRMVDSVVPTGYSAAGRILAVGPQVEGFKIGDFVGCAGAGIANHADVIDVPVNLAVRIPNDVPIEAASTVTLGAIAMQGVRRFSPTLGESVAVIGLGILGQITIQILIANGCRVIGIDSDINRVKVALACGLEHGFEPSETNLLEKINIITDGFGVDGVIITAATNSDSVINDSMRFCRRKGRVVLVGDVGLKIQRNNFYRKEIDLYMSCSYGPGRYDPVYEEHGLDYPLPYVRWTENRNMEAYLRLIKSGAVDLSLIPTERYSVTEANSAFAGLKDSSNKPLLVFLSYPDCQDLKFQANIVRQINPVNCSGKLSVALIGAGGFAQGTHLPNLAKLGEKFELRYVVSKTGANARSVADQYGFGFATTDYEEVLEDKCVDLIIICTRHNLHVPMALKALQAGKHVLLEKPLAISRSGLAQIVEFFETRTNTPVLMTGFNRRFSPAIKKVFELVSKRCGPILVNYRMNAGFLQKDHWVHGEEGGGRNIGEACHIYDLFNFLVGSAPVAISASAVTSQTKHWSCHDNFVATVKYDDGSVCNLVYTSIGSTGYPKETMEIFVDGQVVFMNDFRSVDVYSSSRKVWKYGVANKGQLEELVALSGAISSGAKWPISLEDQILATKISFDVEEELFQ